MWNPIESYRQARARRRYIPKTRRTPAGTITKVSLAAVVVIIAASAVLELRGGREGPALAAYLEESGSDPLEIVESAVRGRRLVFLADVPGSTAAKRLAAEAIGRIGRGTGIDVVALQVDSTEQPYIDQYLNTAEEDASILLARPRAVREGEGLGNAYLDIYRAVRRVNDALSADQHIRILALDLGEWPPRGALAPNELAQRYGQRDAAMQARIEAILAREPRTRMLLFLDGFHALKSGGANVQTGGTRTVEVQWLATRLAQRFPQDVYSILVDAPATASGRALVAAYRGTAAGPLLAEQLGGRTVAARVRQEPFAFTRQPVRASATPGISFELAPRTFSFGEAADAYIYLGR